MHDPHHLQRFVEAQRHSYDDAVRELSRGRKTSHWMWFVFPQIAGLGRSDMAIHYAIADRAEARAYLAHPLLGQRLREVTELVAGSAVDAETLMGGIDAVKLRSSLTLFSAAADDPSPFDAALAHLFGGERDGETLRRL